MIDARRGLSALMGPREMRTAMLSTGLYPESARALAACAQESKIVTVESIPRGASSLSAQAAVRPTPAQVTVPARLKKGSLIAPELRR